jgi:hypothetical protein
MTRYLTAVGVVLLVLATWCGLAWTFANTPEMRRDVVDEKFDLLFLAEAVRQCNAHCDLTGTAEWTATQLGSRTDLRCACKVHNVGVRK